MLLLGHWLLAGDLHVEPQAGSAAPAHYGDDTNWSLLQSTIAAMRKADPNPQVVILTGDFLAHHFPPNVPLAITTMTRMAHAFDAAFPRAQFVIVPGNNDDPCGDYRATPGSPYFRQFARVWAPLVNRGGAAPNFERDFARYGWYSARLPIRGVRVFALDTVYWSIVYRRCANYHPDAPQRELAWLQRSLQRLAPVERAILVMHIPPGVDPTSTMLTQRFLVVPYWQQPKLNAFVRMVIAHDAQIPLAIAGHTHRSDFRLIASVPLLLAPAVSPVYQNNPAFLRLDVGAGGTLRDYTMFDYDPSSGWQRENSFDRTFGVRDFTARSLAAIHTRLRADLDLRYTWSELFVSGSPYLVIDANTWRTYWCAQTELSAGFVACAGLQRRTQVLPVAAGVAAAIVIALLALLAVRLGRQRRRS